MLKGEGYPSSECEKSDRGVALSIKKFFLINQRDDRKANVHPDPQPYANMKH